MSLPLLDDPLAQAMELAWQSACAGSLGIGAVITRPDGTVVATGRNRLFETDPGDDHLAGTSLAHAETNALAKLRWGQYRDDGLILWTTLQPCIQCLGAIRLSAIARVVVLAPDPLFRGVEGIRHVVPFLNRNWPTIDERPIDEWSVLALLLPSHAAAFWNAWAPGWQEAVPVISSLAARLAHDRTLLTAVERATPLSVLAETLRPDLASCVDEMRRLADLGST